MEVYSDKEAGYGGIASFPFTMVSPPSSRYLNGYQIEIYDLRTGNIEVIVEILPETDVGLEQARSERRFWEKKCSINWGVRIRKISNGMIH